MLNSVLRALVLCTCIGSTSMWMMGCNNDDPSPSFGDLAQSNRDSIISFLEANELSELTEEHSSGIFYQRIVETDGPQVGSGDVLSIYYEANALGLQSFARISREAGDDSVKLQHDTRSVYPIGLDVGLGLMREGETFVFYLPATQAYDTLEDLSSIIPPGSVVRITVELALIESEDQIHTIQINGIEQLIARDQLNDLTLNPLDSFDVAENGLYYKRTSAGVEDSTLNEGQPAGLNYTVYNIERYSSGPVIESVDGLPFTNSGGQLFEGLLQGVRQMEFGERAVFMIPSRIAYGASAFVIPTERKQYLVEEDVIPQYAAKVSPYQTLVFEVELVNPSRP